MLLRAIFAAVIALAAMPAFSTPQLNDATDMWLSPGEAGWGINFFHQGDTLFAALFVYGPDRQPKWYVASNLVGSGDRAATYTGALFEATGPYFGAAFDPGTVVRRQVGTMSVQLGQNQATLDYTVDGVHVTKSIQRFAFRSTSLSGQYIGFQFQPASGSRAEVRHDVNIVIDDDGTHVHMATDSDSESSCSYDGLKSQSGSLALVQGKFSCGTQTGDWSMQVDVTPHGFTGGFAGNGITGNDIVGDDGRIAASRRTAPVMDGNGWRDDLWFAPNESGWGLNVVEQGQTLFATLFVYDQQRQTHWFVASDLERSGSGFSGALYEANGSYFGAPFATGGVTLRQVGTMTFEVRDAGTASLTYTVDGVSVSKTVSRFAFRKNDLTGHYVGHLAGTSEDPGGASHDTVDITINDDASGFTMQTIGHAAPSCNYSAPPAQQLGAQRFVSGSFSCNSGRTGTFEMQDVLVTFDGFTSRILHHNSTAPQGAGITIGHMEGARRDAN